MESCSQLSSTEGGITTIHKGRPHVVSEKPIPRQSRDASSSLDRPIDRWMYRSTTCFFFFVYQSVTCLSNYFIYPLSKVSLVYSFVRPTARPYVPHRSSVFRACIQPKFVEALGKLTNSSEREGRKTSFQSEKEGIASEFDGYAIGCYLSYQRSL